MNYTKEQAEQIYKQAQDQGLDPDVVMSKLAARGAVFEGIDNAQAQEYAQQYVQEPKKLQFGSAERGLKIAEKVADFTGGKELAQAGAVALAKPFVSKKIEETQAMQGDVQNRLIERIKEKKAKGEDTTVLMEALKELGGNIQEFGEGAEKLLNPNDLTPSQVVGDALQLAGTAVGGKVAGAVAGKATGAVGAARGALQGAGTGAATGAITGGITGVSQELQSKDEKSIASVLESGAKGAVVGGIGGAVLGGLAGGISGGLKGKALRQAVLDEQITTGQKVLDPEILNKKAVQIAKQQGFDDTDIQFLQTMKPADKTKAVKMIELAQKATDKRSLERPIDVVGDGFVERIKFIQGKNAKAGQAVDATAKALRGQKVDATPVREKALALLEDAGVYANPDGTPNWSKSVFNKTPELKKLIMKSFSDLPAGEIDAYDLHNFKKSIDEVVNHGVGGEGLKGKSASILKAVRTQADDVLDSSFDAYNKANTDYKVTREVLDQADDLFGKKVGISKERGGQLLRSVFSNNTQRPRVLSLIEAVDKTAKQYGGKVKDNLVDQALFTEILEDVYGTQATTSLQGQVRRAVSGTQKLIAGVRNPVQGVGEAVATIAEKTAGISPENKKKILKALLSASQK